MKKNNGVFVDCRSHWKGRIGDGAFSLAKYQGGVIIVGVDGQDKRDGLAAVALRLGVRLWLTCCAEQGSEDYGKPVLIRQEHDPAPKFHFLEEGSVRLGMRVAFDLLDEAGHYHGDGRTDIWLYPEGDLHITWAVQCVDLVAHKHISDCYVEAVGNNGYREIRLGDANLTQEGATGARRFGKELGEKAVVFSGTGGMAGLYWARDEGHGWPVGSDHGTLPPFYASRWPTGMQQWCVEGMGWNCKKEVATVEASVEEDGPAARFAWMRGGDLEKFAGAATLVVSLAAGAEALAPRILAVQDPLTPTVSGGTFRCYTEEDGTYEVGQADPTRVEVVFPADPLARPVRLLFYRRKTDPRHQGGVRATVDGVVVPVQLISDGELTDDICVVMDMSQRKDSVDNVLLAAALKTDGPTLIIIEKLPGIQVTYQSEITGVDLQRRAGNKRDVAVWSSHNKERPLYELDLFSGAVHRATQYGHKEPALWEMPMAWFASCGISKHQYCNFIKEFSVVENGPDAVELYVRGTNPNQRAQSELWLRTPYNHPRLRMEVRMRMEVLEQWDDANVEFSDIFPYPSRLVETWFHDAVLFLQEGGSSTIYTYRPDLSVSNPGAGGKDLFYGLFATERGNVLTLVKNKQHLEHPLHYAVCGNYIDIHVNLHPGEAPVAAGKVFEVEYVTELYGDEETSADEIRQIGQRSLAAGDIVVD
jgi:hypothetical protein